MMLEFIVCHCWVLYCVGMFFLVILTLNEYLLIHEKECGCITEERKDILNVNEVKTSDDEVVTKEMGDYEETIKSDVEEKVEVVKPLELHPIIETTDYCGEDFVAIDFETAVANKPRHICQVGISVVSGGFIKSYGILVKPYGNVYDHYCHVVHGLSSADTENSPMFNVVWESIKHFFEGSVIVAHNVGFDLEVLYENLYFYGLPLPNEKRVVCTMELNNRCSLYDCAKHYGIEMKKHHDALSDALTCAKIYIAMQKPSADTNVERVKYCKHEKIDSVYLAVKKDAPKDSFFYGKKVVISGVFREVGRNQLAKVLQMRGADVNICVSKRTDILICGKNCGWSKVEKAEKYGVRMIDEDELLEIMDNDDMICNDDSVKEDESIIVV